MNAALVRKTRFTTFDGTLSLAARHQRPDRFSHLEAPGRDEYRIARGGGYAYSAASFAEHTLVQEMTCFNRFLAFDPEQLTLTLEAGVCLRDLMTWALPRQLHFPVLPGYPLITVGGCVAADVHGKNPYRDGTFADWVTQLTVYHPHRGYQRCSRTEQPELFALTCGGFGLTGVITDVTLQLAHLPAPWIALSRSPVAGLEDAVRALRGLDADIAYSWHDVTPGAHCGRGIVYSGQWTTRAQPPKPLRFRPMTAQSRARLPVSAWNGVTARLANTALRLHSRYQRDRVVMSVMQAAFPFARNVYFHTLFGRPGLRETQFLVSEDRVHDCLEALRTLVCARDAPAMMLSLKRFKGVQQSLSMSGTGFLLALDCYRNAATETFLQRLDELMLAAGGQPNLSKDSRLPREVAAAGIANFAAFQQRLLAYDAARIMRSELSARLGLQ